MLAGVSTEITAAVIGVVGALVGGAGAVFGGRWAARRDLREHNRHALHLDELPAAIQATDAWLLGTDLHARIGAERISEYARTLSRVVNRSALLDHQEREIGSSLRPFVQKLDGEAEVLHLTSGLDSWDLAEEPWPDLLRNINGQLKLLETAVAEALG